jgi:hypothetical protein
MKPAGALAPHGFHWFVFMKRRLSAGGLAMTLTCYNSMTAPRCARREEVFFFNSENAKIRWKGYRR